MSIIKKILNPKVLSALAMVGVVATAIVGAIEGQEAEETIEEAKESFPEDKKRTPVNVIFHMVPRVIKKFVKTIVVGGVTIICIFMSSYLSGLQIAALTGTVTYMVTQRDAIEKEIVKMPGGKEALTKVKSEMSKLTLEKATKKEPIIRAPWKSQTIEETGYGDEIIIDTFSGRIYKSDHVIVMRQLEKFNQERDEGFDLPFGDGHEENLPLACPYNDIFIAQNLEPTEFGYQYGWPANDDYYDHREIPFKIEKLKLEDMDPTQQKRYGGDVYMLSMEPDYYPMPGWLEV